VWGEEMYVRGGRREKERGKKGKRGEEEKGWAHAASTNATIFGDPNTSQKLQKNKNIKHKP
jgi:hypothetical protein